MKNVSSESVKEKADNTFDEAHHVARRNRMRNRMSMANKSNIGYAKGMLVSVKEDLNNNIEEIVLEHIETSKFLGFYWRSVGSVRKIYGKCEK